MANLDLAVARIRNRALQLPAAKRASYVAQNISHQQDLIHRFISGRAPAGWSVAASTEYIHRLIQLEAMFHENELEAA